jgi:hypothetical protein
MQQSTTVTLADGRNKNKSFRVQGTARQGSVGIFHLAFLFAASWEPPYYLLVDVSSPMMGRDFPGDVRRECLSSPFRRRCGLALTRFYSQQTSFAPS